MQPVVYVDARCLQDERYRVRGIGQHVTALLRTRNRSAFSNWKMVALGDAQAEKLPAECADLFDTVSFSLAPPSNSTPTVFLDGTPMTHDPRFSLGFVGNPQVFTAAVIYDFIPLDWPGYLETTPSRIQYLAKIARLRSFDAFFPISEYSAWRLSELLSTRRSRIHVTGASVRRQLYELRHSVAQAGPQSDDPYFVIVIASDPRKNPEVPIKAVKQLNLVHQPRIRLKVAGHYPEHFKQHLLNLAGHEEDQGFLEFCPNVSDRELMEIYAGAIATIVPSHIEGFSLTAVEPALCGCPVIASSCAAHLELIRQAEALFPSHDAATLTARLEALLTEPCLRGSLVDMQAHLAAQFHENEVGQRFWHGLEIAVDRRRTLAFGKPKKPRLAFLSPYPPDSSKIALHTKLTMRAGGGRFDSDIYTDSPRPLLLEEDSRDAGRVSIAAVVDRRYSAILSVLSDSSSVSTFDFFERYGGACILHDLRFVDAYRRWLGEEEVLRFASTVLNRPASPQDLLLPLRHTEEALLLVERILRRASPVIVQSKAQQAILRQRYGVEAHLTPCCPLYTLTESARSVDFRRAARERLGISPGTFLITSFGVPSAWNGHEMAIMALEFLRYWNIPAQLFFGGDAADQLPHMKYMSQVFSVGDYVHCGAEFGTEDSYRDLLAASDCGLQVRHYEFGKTSTHLCNIISAALPCVTTEDMALSCDAPGYVFTVPNYFSPLLIAEQLATVYDANLNRSSFAEACFEYSRTHNFNYYGTRLMEILGLL